MKYLKQMLCVGICGVMLAAATGCSGSLTGGKRIIRISRAQSETHPEHLGLLKFKEYVEANLGNKYEIQIFPNELPGSAQSDGLCEIKCGNTPICSAPPAGTPAAGFFLHFLLERVDSRGQDCYNTHIPTSLVC